MSAVDFERSRKAIVARRSNRNGGKPEAPADGDVDARALPLFSIVGIGASAGGLEAISQLLEHLPADIGMALVVVQHLAPAHESILAELLGHKSPLPVSEISDDLTRQSRPRLRDPTRL